MNTPKLSDSKHRETDTLSRKVLRRWRTPHLISVVVSELRNAEFPENKGLGTGGHFVPDTPDGLSGTPAADTLSLLRECPPVSVRRTEIKKATPL